MDDVQPNRLLKRLDRVLELDTPTVKLGRGRETDSSISLDPRRDYDLRSE